MNNSWSIEKINYLLITHLTCLLSVSTLKCYRCIPPNPDDCAEAQCFSSAYLCGALKFTSFAGMLIFYYSLFSFISLVKFTQESDSFVPGDLQIAQTRMRACLPPEECVENSVNFGTARIMISSNCCSSDLCNTIQAPGNCCLMLFAVETRSSFLLMRHILTHFNTHLI